MKAITLVITILALSTVATACGETSSVVSKPENSAISKAAWTEFSEGYTDYVKVVKKSNATFKAQCSYRTTGLDDHICIMQWWFNHAANDAVMASLLTKVIPGASGDCRERLVAWQTLEVESVANRLHVFKELAIEHNDALDGGERANDGLSDKIDTETMAAIDSCKQVIVNSAGSPYAENAVTDLLTLDLTLATAEAWLNVPRMIECMRSKTSVTGRAACAKPLLADYQASITHSQDVVREAKNLSQGTCLAALSKIETQLHEKLETLQEMKAAISTTSGTTLLELANLQGPAGSATVKPAYEACLTA